jgi:hypothetical protein
MKAPARLIIPLWGEVYAQKLVSITLPALLAPGNLPALCDAFDVELVLVTESRLFARIRQAESFRLVSKRCRTNLVSLDDLLTELPGDYGVVLTYALYRGFTDLGARMTETYLLFLNADFIICDGALRHLAKLMGEGKKVIHAPSFRVVLEDVWPQLQARVDPSSLVLSLAAREMVKLALAHKHLTVRARTVNQRLCHQTWMDQFYWYVDDDTLIGYQWPVALVAIKPERVLTEPVLVWDYGFIPEASPGVERHFIADSDDFFMLEPQKRTTGEELVRIGWVSTDDIARDLSKWTTKEQRDCGHRLLKIHASDLPANIDEVVAESRDFMAEVTRKLTPTPQPHIGHGHLGAWFEAAKERMKGGGKPPAVSPAEGDRVAPVPQSAPAGRPRRKRAILDALRTLYRTTFGSPPQVGRFHPLWLDTWFVNQRIATWTARSVRVLWITSRDSLFHGVLSGRIDTATLFLDDSNESLLAGAPYDACFCELAPDELARLRGIYARIRPLVSNGGEVVVLVSTRQGGMLTGGDMGLCQEAFPAVDISDIRFFGSAASEMLRRAYLRASNSFPGRPLYRVLATGCVLIGLAPFVRLANALGSRRDPTFRTSRWTSLAIGFTVRKGANVRGSASCSRSADAVHEAPASQAPHRVANGTTVC